MRAKTKVVEKESQKIGKGLGMAIGRVVEGYKPQEVNFFRTFFSDLLKSPRATRAAQLKREGAQNIYEVASNTASRQLKEKNKFFNSLSPEELKYARKNLSRQAYNEIYRATENAAMNEAKRFGEYARKELEGLPTWGGVLKNSTKGILNSRLTKYGVPAAAIGYGAYKGLFENSPEEEESSNSNYRWTPNNGWQHRDEQGNWGDQQEEFGVDRFGNTNFYDADTGQWYSDYIQGSDGSVYDRQGNLLGNVLPNGGNFFDYNAQQIAKQLGKSSLSPAEIMALQQQLGVTPDGLIGARTLNAIAKQSGNPENYFTIYR